MTETQNRRRPLAPGEIRSQWVGNQLFQVMHVSGGSFTQASVREHGQPSRVIATEMFEQDAVRAYADAIEQAEADYADADREDDAPEPLTAEGIIALGVRSGFTPALNLDKAIAECKRFEEIDRAAVARGESANWWERGTESSTTLADRDWQALYVLGGE